MPSKASTFTYVVLIIILFAGLSGVSLAAVPYRNYTYDFWGRVAPSPQAYVPMGVISGMDLGMASSIARMTFSWMILTRSMSLILVTTGFSL